MTIVFLGMLVLAWAAVVMPALSRARREAPLRSTERFSRGMASIAPPSVAGELRPALFEPPLPAPTPRVRRRVDPRRTKRIRRMRRRRAALGALALAAILTAIGASLWSVLWMVHLLLDIACATFCGVLVGERNRRLERRRKVHRISRPAPRRIELARAEARRA